MNNSELISKTRIYVKKKMEGEATGHDWWHIRRVVEMAMRIAKEEKDVNLFIIEAAALLHDIGDWKINNSEKSEEEILQETLELLQFPEDASEKILHIILNMSYSNNLDGKTVLSREGCIVQDADRLDALGAIGIARAFAYGGKKNKEIYNPEIKLQTFSSTKAYRTAKSTSVNHFYEKLFLLRDLLHTERAKKLAVERQTFMQKFLEQFYQEWEGKR